MRTLKTAQPHYRRIKDDLRARILSGELKGGDAIPDERTFAQDVGLSRMTVRRALVELTSEGLLNRVRGKGTFVRDSLRAPRRVRKSTVAVIHAGAAFVPQDRALDLFYYRMLHGISLGCQELRMQLAFVPPSPAPQALVAALNDERGLSGAIALGLDDLDLLKELGNLTIPVVLLDSVQPPGGVLMDEVVHEDEAAVFDAITHLIDLGHRDIGLMQSACLNEINRQREAGFRRALAARGLPWRPERAYPTLVSSSFAYERMKGILNSGDVPTALFCTGDHLAVGALAAIHDAGWQVPRDISVVGFGDEGYFLSPALSTVRIPMEKLGIQAVRMLGERIRKPAAPRMRAAFPSEWIARASCGLPRGAR